MIEIKVITYVMIINRGIAYKIGRQTRQGKAMGVPDSRDVQTFLHPLCLQRNLELLIIGKIADVSIRLKSR